MSESVPAALPQLPWTQGERARLAAALKADRMPHALLIHEAPGAGGEWLAFWTAQLALCEHREEAPCGRCTACRRVAARAHPDLLILAPEEDSTQIRIEQVRELGAELALTSHGGGYKLGVVSPADGLNRFAANALLKTLEEPPPRTLLILVATQPSRLPATILSRCQRLKVTAPTRAASLKWLTAAGGEKPWGPALDTLGEAPLKVLGSDPGAVAEAAEDTRRTLEAFLAGAADPAATAERWTRSELPLRLRATENWLTDRIRWGGSGGRLMPEVRGGPHLSGGRPVLNIRELFRLVDEVRELRATLDVPLNRGVALEALFRRLAP